MYVPVYFRVEMGGPRISILHTKNLDVESEGLVVDMTYFDTGKGHSFNVIANSVWLETTF